MKNSPLSWIGSLLEILGVVLLLVILWMFWQDPDRLGVLVYPLILFSLGVGALGGGLKRW